MGGHVVLVKAWHTEAKSGKWTREAVGMCGGSGRTLDGGEPSPPEKGLPWERRARMLESRNGRGDIGVVGGRGGGQSYPPPLSRCGHKEGAPGISCRVEGVAGGWGTAAV